MNKMLVINSDDALSEKVRNIVYELDKAMLIIMEDKLTEALAYLNYELPKLLILNFADDNIDAYAALASIREDLWLNNGGLIAVHKEVNEDAFLRKCGFANFLSVIHENDVAGRLPTIMEIILGNEDLILQREIPEKFIDTLSFDFIIDNNPFFVSVYANLVSLYLYNANMISIDQKNQLKNSLLELVMNGIEHGNCGITFDEKTEAQEEGISVLDLIAERNKDPEVARRKVVLNFRVNREHSLFSIRDEGPGFDWRKHLKSLSDEDNRTLAHGRGIYMTHSAVPGGVEYNESGNEVSFEFMHQDSLANFRPKIFQNKQEIHVHAGDIIFLRGDWSNFLSYIVAGRYDVLDDQGKVFATLTPNDIFIGEMAFLLGNIRTATVQAATSGTLIRLTKREFVEAIKELPHYGLFLARLIAQRMEKINLNLFSMETKKEESFLFEAQAAYDERDYKTAVFLLKHAHKKYPSDMQILYYLSKYLVFFQNFQQAAYYMAKYIDIVPNNPTAFVLLGYAEYRMGHFQTAKSAFEACLDLDREHKNARYYLAKVLYKSADSEKADQVIEELLNENPGHPKLLHLKQLMT